MKISNAKKSVYKLSEKSKNLDLGLDMNIFTDRAYREYLRQLMVRK